jgi:DNA-binding transcriptional LysR family regulator
MLDAAFLRPDAAGTGELQVRRLSEEPMVVALPKRDHAAAFEQIDLALLKDDPFLLFPREIAPTLYDTVVDACRKAGFEPIIGQLAPHMASIVNFVAARHIVSHIAGWACSVAAGPYSDVPSGSIPLFLMASEARSEARNSISRLEASISPEPATTAAENTCTNWISGAMRPAKSTPAACSNCSLDVGRTVLPQNLELSATLVQ